MIDMERLPELEPPYEILEIPPAVPVYLKVTGYKLGKMTISPRYPGAPPEKDVIAIRLFVDPETKKHYPLYWDITPARLVYQLAPMLVQGIPKDKWLRIYRDIPGPKAHFSVAWVEVPG
jgi:hypothetical protein